MVAIESTPLIFFIFIVFLLFWNIFIFIEMLQRYADSLHISLT